MSKNARIRPEMSNTGVLTETKNTFNISGRDKNNFEF